jgi:hypothetical protein
MSQHVAAEFPLQGTVDGTSRGTVGQGRGFTPVWWAGFEWWSGWWSGFEWWGWGGWLWCKSDVAGTQPKPDKVLFSGTHGGSEILGPVTDSVANVKPVGWVKKELESAAVDSRNTTEIAPQRDRKLLKACILLIVFEGSDIVPLRWCFVVKYSWLSCVVVVESQKTMRRARGD